MKTLRFAAVLLAAAMLLPAGASAQSHGKAGTATSVSARKVTSSQKTQTRVDKVQQPTNVKHQPVTHREVTSAAAKTRVSSSSASSTKTRVSAGSSSSVKTPASGASATAKTPVSKSPATTSSTKVQTSSSSASSARKTVETKPASTTKNREKAGTLSSRTVSVSQTTRTPQTPQETPGKGATTVGTGRVNPNVTNTSVNVSNNNVNVNNGNVNITNNNVNITNINVVNPKVPQNYGRDNGRGKDYGRYGDHYRQPQPHSGYRFNGDPYVRPRWEDYRAYQRYQIPYVVYRPVPVVHPAHFHPVPPVPVYTQPQIVTRTNARQIVLYTDFYSKAEAYGYVSQLLADQYYDIAAYDTGYGWFTTEITAVPIPDGWTNPYTHNEFRIRFNFDQLCRQRIRIVITAEWRESQLVTMFTPLRFQPSNKYSTYYAWNVLEDIASHIPHTSIYYR